MKRSLTTGLALAIFGVLAAITPATARAQYVVQPYCPPPVTYYTPPTYSYYTPPSYSFYTPATTSYYSAPVTAYYGAPATSYYSAPVTSYYAPAGVSSTTTTYYRGLFRPRVYSQTNYYTPLYYRY